MIILLSSFADKSIYGNIINIIREKESPDFKEFVEQGAVIFDVRSVGVFRGGQINKSKNISVQNLPAQLSKLDKTKIIITCCAPGMHSASGCIYVKTRRIYGL